ncbi:MAG: hypothetical protein ACXW4B_05675 [Micavibrio sp.]
MNATITTSSRSKKRPCTAGTAFIAIMALFMLVTARPAEAVSVTNPPIDTPPHVTYRDQMVQFNYVRAIMIMTEQMSVVMLQQLPIIGSFLDAKTQMETQRLFGLTAAIAHRDYQPDEKICAFGTLARATAVSKYAVDQNTVAITAVLLKRDLLNANQSSAWGPFSDVASRLAKFKTTYCDPNDNNQTLDTILCTPGSPSARKNKDIDYRRVIENNLTLDVDFLNGGTPTPDEEDVLALAKNLYSHETLTPIGETAMVPAAGGEGSFRELHNSRNLAAIRSVSRHSYATLAAMRSTGSGLASTQLRQVMQNLGVAAGDVDALIGANPSYFAQMDIFTQKIFQDPSFMVSLYSGPANVARMGVVLQGIKLMSDRDKLDAYLRREMLLSMILEMKLRDRQAALTNETNKTISNQ